MVGRASISHAVGRAALAGALVALALAMPAVADAQLLNFFGDERVGSSGGQFLRIPAGARNIGMGGGMSATVRGASAPFWNPAGMSTIEGNGRLLISHMEYVADIDVDHLAYVRRFGHWLVGISGGVLRSGDIVRTTEFHPDGAGTTFEANQFMMGFSFGRRLTQRFAVATTVKLLQENLDEFTSRGVLLDIGALYYTGFKRSRIGFSVRNFGGDMKLTGQAPSEVGPDPEFQAFPAPTVAVFGFAYDFGTPAGNMLTISMDFDHPSDGQESLVFGGEISMKDRLYLWGGYRNNTQIEGFSAGFGLRVLDDAQTLRLGYGYSERGAFGDLHSISLQIGK